MNWAYPNLLWNFALLPILVVLSWKSWHLAQHNFSKISGGRTEWTIRGFLRDLSMACFISLMILAMAEPRKGRQSVAEESSGLDIAVAFDISRSMLASDVSPTRLGQATASLRFLLRSLPESRFALIPFKGDAFVAVPMTEDRVTLDLLIDHLSPGLSTVPGTNTELALRVAQEAFPQGSGRRRIIIMMTDGESLKGKLAPISRELAEVGIPVHALAVGSSEGHLIKLADGKHIRNKLGQLVMSRVDTQALKKVATDTGGSFGNLSWPKASAHLVQTLEDEKTFTEDRGIIFLGIYRYRIFLIPALFFLFLFFITRIFPWRRK